jgi:hypothetical protein
MRPKLGLPLVALSFAGCGARTSLDGPPSPCDSTPPTCIASNATDPCGAPSVVPPSCDVGSRGWVCPKAARIYARAAEPSPVCRPFYRDSAIQNVGPWGLSAMTEVPIDDGRCLWIADSATLGNGTRARNVAFEPDVGAPSGTCPGLSVALPEPIVTMDGGDDPTILVQIDGGYRIVDVTHVLYRLFRADPSAVYGAVEIGGGVGRWDATTRRIVVHSASAPMPWGLDLDLGDASLVTSDGNHAFVWGCAQPGQFLLQGCEVALLDPNDAIELFSKTGAWLPTVDASQGATLFGSGTWNSSVVVSSSGLRHIYAFDFGDTIKSHVAARVTGPWTEGPDLAACDLPRADDPNSFCAGPIVHAELSGPTRPGELAISYGVGSSKTPTGSSDDYWSRLAWMK